MYSDVVVLPRCQYMAASALQPWGVERTVLRHGQTRTHGSTVGDSVERTVLPHGEQGNTRYMYVALYAYSRTCSGALHMSGPALVLGASGQSRAVYIQSTCSGTKMEWYEHVSTLQY